MEDLEKILENMKNLDEVRILVRVLNMQQVKDFIIFLNTERQLRLGIDSEDGVTGLYRSFSYASEKLSTGGKAPFGVVDLHVSGDYFKTFVVDVLNSGDFIIDSDTVKPDRDLRDIVDNIEGLIDKNIDLLVDMLIPLFIRETEKEILR